MNDRPRRAPAERRRDPERTKERILAAALTEFSAKGFAGARVSEIAESAGVNKQLISYYFGGKEGLYRALSDRWRGTEESFADPETPLPRLLASYATHTLRNLELGRLFIWEGLTGEGPDPGRRREELRRNVEDLRRRQATGEIPADLDPAHLLLVLYAAAAAGVALPHLVRAIHGVDPGDETFVRDYAEQLARLFGHLRVARDA